MRFVGFSTHATTDIILEAVNSGEFDYMNVHWYFVNDLNWAAIKAARAHDMGVFIISPNDKGGKLYEPPKKLIELCADLMRVPRVPPDDREQRQSEEAERCRDGFFHSPEFLCEVSGGHCSVCSTGDFNRCRNL